MNPLQKLHTYKQSFWYDFIRRSLMTSGDLKKLIDKHGLRGMTSNPAIFEKAIAAGTEYDADFKGLASKGLDSPEIFEALAIKDIQMAADVFKPIFKSSGGEDGYVSLEVDPNLAYNTEKTIADAKRLFKKVGRPNLMIKIPATKQGLPAIEEATAAGINVNITLIFSVDYYKQVVEAYLRGLERRVKKGQPIKNIVSVASFFVSRVDVAVDKLLDGMIAQGGDKADMAAPLLHKAAIANSKIAYAHFEQVFGSERFKKLEKKGARVQRLLWGSTGTKDARLSDVIYVEELIGPYTVNTMPPQTSEAFADHGRVENTLQQNVDQAARDLDALARVGIDLKTITDELLAQGVQLFIEAFAQLMQGVGAKRELFTGQHDKKMQIFPGRYEMDIKQTFHTLKAEKWVERMWKKEAALWKSEEDHQRIIKNSLGWLTVPRVVQSKLARVQEIVKDVQKAKFSHALILGMGGSSLCPEVLRLTFGKKGGFPDFAILDSTEPASVKERAARAKPEKTLFIVASKSGSTTEPNAFLAYFYDQVKKKKGTKAGENFIAITDPGTTMERIAREKNFRHIVLNPSDIGGRYSALSFFGMLPAALMGIDLPKFLDRALRMSAACSPAMPPDSNPGARLGAALGTLAQKGVNKVTFTLSKDIASFATWVEQLIAESTGKEGVGILPVESEPLESPDIYTDNRVFVSIRTKKSAWNAAEKKKWDALKKAGHPAVEVVIDDIWDIGAEFFRWEIATALAGKVMGIDPFDQPNVQDAKDATKKLLGEYTKDGSFPQEKPWYEESGLKVYTSNGHSPAKSLQDVLSAVVGKINKRDYVALLAYLKRDVEHTKALQDIREEFLKSKHVATTVGFGPRFLHSTGQLHKGGDSDGVFISITADDKQDLPIPGEPYTYSVLKEAQARGDWEALKSKARRAVHFHFSDAKTGLKKIKTALQKISKG